MPKIENFDRVQRRLEHLAKVHFKSSAAVPRQSVIVGYTANYALYVHENIEMKLKGQPRQGSDAKGQYWDPQGMGQAKFLEQPAREMAGQIADEVRKNFKARMPIIKALFKAGLLLQRASQKLVPVDTGNLKASAFTREE